MCCRSCKSFLMLHPATSFLRLCCNAKWADANLSAAPPTGHRSGGKGLDLARPPCCWGPPSHSSRRFRWHPTEQPGEMHVVVRSTVFPPPRRQWRSWDCFLKRISSIDIELFYVRGTSLHLSMKWMNEAFTESTEQFSLGPLSCQLFRVMQQNYF